MERSVWSRPARSRSYFWAWVKYWGWTLFTKLPLGLIYVLVISEGLRTLIPPLGQRLHRVPGLAWLQAYEGWHRFDLAIPFSVFLLIAVFYLWSRIIRLWKWSDDDPNVWFTGRESQLVTILGVIILGADAILFYTAIADFAWGGGLSLSALIATLAYIAVLIFVSYVSVNLEDELHATKGD